MEKTYCVYKHTTPSRKIYIGVTCKKPERRWNNGNGYAHNKHFYAAIKKYGWENIQHKVVERGLSKEQASQEEKRLISLYKSNDPMYGYNNTSGGYEGYALTEEQVNALKERSRKQFSDDAFKERFDTLMNDPGRRKRVSDGLRRYYESPGAREKASAAQKKKWENEEYRKRFKEIAQKRARNPEFREKLSKVLTAKRSSIEYRKSMTGGNNPNAKSVLQYSLTGELVERFDSIADACRKHGFNHANIVACVKGRVKYSYGFIWAYDGEESSVNERVKTIESYVSPKARPIIQCDLNGEKIKRFRSIREAAEECGASSGTIGMALRGKRKTAYGFIWKYADLKEGAAI